jgi:hypothetical protein
MTEAETPLEQGTETLPEVPGSAEVPPTDFREYERWRRTGELPEQEEVKPAAAETPAKTAPDSEPDDKQETGEEEHDEAATGRGSSRQRKIDRLVKENTELQQRVLALEQKPLAAEEPGQKPKAPADGKPKLEDYQTLEDYQEALTDWKLDDRERKRQAAEAEREAREASEKVQAAWSKQVKAASKVHEDYEDVIDTVKAPEGPGVAAARQAMLEDDNGAEILYYLAKHPADMKRIAALSPVSAVREIGKLSASFTPAPENGKPKVTGAPKPPPPSGRPSKVTSESLDDPEVVKDYARWEKLRRAQLGRK